MKNLLYLLILLASVSKANAEYTVTWSGKNPPKISIEATLTTRHGKLQMVQWSASQFKSGWANFVEDLKVFDEKGEPLSFQTKDTANWQLNDTTSRRIKISYKVNLSFTTQKWLYGNEQAGYYKDSILLLTGMSVFIFSDVDTLNFVTFKIDNNQSVEAPWEKLSENKYMVKNISQLTSNCFALGKLDKFSFQSGKFNCHLVLLGYGNDTKKLVAACTKKIVDYYGTLFPSTPSSDYLIAIFKYEDNDSEGYDNSTCISETDDLEQSNIISWGNTIAHEIFHSWNGLAIKGENYAFSQWFTEGFTEYYATTALLNSGFISTEQYLSRIEKNLGLYSMWRLNGIFNEYSLKEAGLKKGRNRAAIYNGGFSTALCLDILIRNNSNNKSSLDDVMRDAYSGFGVTNKKFTVEELQLKFKKYLPDADSLFNKYISGKELIEFSGILSDAGFNCITNYYDGIVFINLMDNPSAKQLLIRKSLINK